MSSFQEDLADWVLQPNDDELVFRLPIGYRMITLVLCVAAAAASTWSIGFSHDSTYRNFGWAGAMLGVLLLYASLPRELYLNFSTRTYKKRFGWGPIAFIQEGPFSEIESIYVKKKRGSEKIPSIYAAMEFKAPISDKRPMPLPLDWHLVSTEPTKEPAIRKYAKDLAFRLKVPMKIHS